jgi:Protein of unknown function (DUF2934)
MSKSVGPKAGAPKKASASKSPTHEEIALRAYHIFLRRNGAPGDPHADWVLAEHELVSEKATKPRARRKSNVTSIAA